MVEKKQDILARAYTNLSALRKNIGEMTDYLVPETYVKEFHAVLDRIEGIGIDVSEFRIPDSEVKLRTVASQYVGGRKVWANEVIGVEKSFILIKLDAILGYFEIITSEKPRAIGFNK
ncbi:hypothetical protein ACFLVU_00980 [Chloroflexota bacterium]